MQTRFSTQQRDAQREYLENTSFDMIVIGGGITGSGIALDAVTRGMKVALIERKDFASGTSSRSGKLIHGGLKYLKNFEFSIVKEVGRERDIVYNNARHLVYPINMVFPLIKGESFNKLTLKAGLTVYDRLAGVKSEERHEIHSKKSTLQNEPLFHKKTVTGSGEYVEYRTDDSRLTMETAKTAFEKGAAVLNYTEMTDFIRDDEEKITGILVNDHLNEDSFPLHGTYIVNAAGPWVDEVRKKDHPITGKHMVHAKGIHLVFPYEKIPVHSSIYFQHNGRMIAVIPRGDTTYVGSTESLYEEDMDNIYVYKSECNYLIGCLYDMFPDLDISIDDIASSWAGIRPLIGHDNSKPSELSRHDEIFESEAGLITIAGGKLTGYRKMAERIMDYVARRGNIKLSPSQTEWVPLAGGNFASDQDMHLYINELYKQYEHLQLSKQDIHTYVFRYGSRTELLLEQIESFDTTYTNHEKRNIAAEAMYTVEHEMVATLADFYDRRTSYLLFDIDRVKRTEPVVTEILANKLNWDSYRKENERHSIQVLIDQALTFLE
ncbi:glycerol-3-phosphate dehydrogenase [Salibacterium salarium]|uniref:glycerol-3-phosphate dehydrogenase/oxidase n=1 Tax=Salibacterium salarium TaxID=284579 RepID=UPI0027858239|nr:glycerol-3-phosphate dehydrogenase/oxidase [Salibacterium salarium]MDQ0298894.1 glycerol-3-phosphate dehydrogenase [Salibacterium salarium]